MNNIALLALYKVEKDALEFPSSPFMSFKEWKEDFMKDRAELFTVVDIDTAVAESDLIVAEAEKEIEQIQKRRVPKETQKRFVKVTDRQPKPVVSEETKKVKKTDLAEQIYKEMMIDGQHPKRADVIARFVSECGLSEAGASTYHHNMKKKFS